MVQPGQESSDKIDVHHHFVPPPFRTGSSSTICTRSCALTDSLPVLLATGDQPVRSLIPEWTPELSVEIMRQLGCKAAILSISTPGPEIVPREAQGRLCREINDWAAKLRDEKPSRFGFFATIPSLLNTDAAIAEIRHALDTLKADGVALFTRYGDGQNYLGHPRFEAIWHELDQRIAVVYIHPIHGADTGVPNSKMPPPFLDYPAETARTAFDMIITGVKRRNPNCKVILSHGGGTLPSLIHRASYMWPHYYPGQATTAEIEEDFRSFYFDLAIAGTKNVVDNLLELVPHDHILFGSDFPYAPSAVIQQMTTALETSKIDPALRSQIYFENALRLFPRLK